MDEARSWYKRRKGDQCDCSLRRSWPQQRHSTRSRSSARPRRRKTGESPQTAQGLEGRQSGTQFSASCSAVAATRTASKQLREHELNLRRRRAQQTFIVGLTLRRGLQNEFGHVRLDARRRLLNGDRAREIENDRDRRVVRRAGKPPIDVAIDTAAIDRSDANRAHDSVDLLLSDPAELGGAIDLILQDASRRKGKATTRSGIAALQCLRLSRSQPSLWGSN
jgi:hypothetical protein